MVPWGGDYALGLANVNGVMSQSAACTRDAPTAQTPMPNAIKGKMASIRWTRETGAG
jgi:hypothetical protein